MQDRNSMILLKIFPQYLRYDEGNDSSGGGVARYH